MIKLDHSLLKLVKQGFDKSAFLPMPGGAQAPDPAMAGGDPMAGGGAPPMDPAMAGGMPPADPSMGGGMLSDPAALSGLGGAPTGMITITVDQLIQLIQAFGGGGKKIKNDGGAGTSSPSGAAPTQSSAGDDRSDLSGKIDQLTQMLQQVMGGQAGMPQM